MSDPTTSSVPIARALHARVWAEAYALIDRQLSPLGLKAIEALGASPGPIILDIGCGTGQTLCQLAKIVGEGGRIIGVDIARPLLDIAERRTRSLTNVTLLEADAQTLALSPRSVDAVYSRFGVMAFADPVAAFTNFRQALRPGGKLAFVCWQALSENELDNLPLAAAGVEDTGDGAPFSFADPGTIKDVLERARFHGIEVRAHRELVSSGDLDAMTEVLLKVGSLGKIVRENPGLRHTAEPRLRAALAELGNPAEVHLAASVWIVTAHAS